MTRPIIGLTGRIGSGKTTAALALCERAGFVRHRFAGPLKSMLHCLGLSPTHTDGELKEEPSEILGGVTPRYAMQTLGTEWGRNLIAEDLWIRAWRATLPAGPVVCDDLRFANEADAVRAAGGRVVLIERPGAIASDHVSERLDFFDPDTVVLNNRGVEDLEEVILALVNILYTFRTRFRKC